MLKKKSSNLFNGAIHKKNTESLKKEESNQNASQSKQVGKTNRQEDSKPRYKEALQHASPFGSHAWIDSHLTNAPGFAEEDSPIHQTTSHPKQKALQKQPIIWQHCPKYRSNCQAEEGIAKSNPHSR